MLNTLKNTKISGYTLIELMVALAIVSILVLAAIPLFSGYSESGKIDELKANLLKAASSQEKYFVNTGKYAASDTTLQKYGFPTPPNNKMKLFTGAIIRQGMGMTYWVAGNYDVNPDVTNAYSECWIYFGSVLGTRGSDNFIRIHQETDNKTTTDCPNCPALDTICK